MRRSLSCSLPLVFGGLASQRPVHITNFILFYAGVEISPHLAEAASFSRMSCAEGPHHALGLKEFHANPEKMVSLNPHLLQQVSSQRPSRKTCEWSSKTREWPPEDKQVAHGQTAQAEWTPKPDPVMFSHHY